MSIFKFIIVGAAVGYGINYITKKNADGRSIIEDLADNAPDWFEKAKHLAQDALGKVSQTAEEVRANF
ncbi:MULTISPECIES: YtxH domain-containing protein [Mucilaginibacter]|uniref:YtxH domain-containing protein n=1 Tax=Mucilaginibacter TaxID=423349 RepID=UPI002092218C|nr:MULTISPECIES: YtxH domain-containing protein [Mucilaginibacter]MCO5949207.1 YtxH domain-containing protein [Mucilaginibacter flavidus]